MPSERSFGKLRLLRPLLDISRAEIEAYASANHLAWVDDESNTDLSITRNYLRHEALTALTQRFPAAEVALAQAAANFAEAGGLLDELAELDWAQAREGDMARLLVCPPATNSRAGSSPRIGFARRENAFCAKVSALGSRKITICYEAPFRSDWASVTIQTSLFT